jgi:hypothetical protein
MSETGIRKEKCTACFSSLAYLAGYCPVCHDTGFVEVREPAPEPSLLGGDFGLNLEPRDPEPPFEHFSVFI